MPAKKFKGTVYTKNEPEDVKRLLYLYNFLHSIVFIIAGIINAGLALIAALLSNVECKLEWGNITYSGVFAGIYVIGAIYCFKKANFVVSSENK